MKSMSMKFRATCATSAFLCGILLATGCTPRAPKHSANEPLPQTAPVAAAPLSPPPPTPESVDKNAGVNEPGTAVERNLNALRILLPGLQGSYFDEKTSTIVLDVFASEADTELTLSKRESAERLLGHPVRIELLSAPLELQDKQPPSQ
jgi:hypothetical protein